MKPEEIKLAYLLIVSPKPSVYLGGAMVVDGKGLPIEFRYTEPIQPSRIQQILYGEQLSSYIKRDVITETLLKNIESRFKCLMISDENLLNYPFRGVSVMRLNETKTSFLGAAGKFQVLSPTEFLLQATREGSPIRVQVPDSQAFVSPKSSENEEDEGAENTAGPLKGKAVDSGDEEEIQLPSFVETLLAAGCYMDIAEPMKRIEKALETICQEEGILSPAK
ncbi:MAG: hypothetical protein K2X66_09625 [Cyanobacteria bacterium]|nr:hypothetical protein [Cyanobacteriota bacterium]